jgi:hypothetical protein
MAGQHGGEQIRSKRQIGSARVLPNIRSLRVIPSIGVARCRSLARRAVTGLLVARASGAGGYAYRGHRPVSAVDVAAFAGLGCRHQRHSGGGRSRQDRQEGERCSGRAGTAWGRYCRGSSSAWPTAAIPAESAKAKLKITSPAPAGTSPAGQPRPAAADNVAVPAQHRGWGHDQPPPGQAPGSVPASRASHARSGHVNLE